LSSIGAIAKTDLKNLGASVIVELKGARIIDFVDAFLRV
jgi:hypothetical protein